MISGLVRRGRSLNKSAPHTLAMRSALPPAVPSRRLLRYLRFQSEGIPFFSPHSHARPTPTCCDQPRGLVAGAAASGVRKYSSSLPKQPDALPRASLFDVRTILPSHTKRVRSTAAHLPAAHNAAAPRRFASTDDKDTGKTISDRLWGPNTVRPDFRSRSTDELETTIFTTSMTGRRAKAALEPVLRCTEVDEKGDAILTDGAFKKSELIAKVRFHAISTLSSEIQRELPVVTIQSYSC